MKTYLLAATALFGFAAAAHATQIAAFSQLSQTNILTATEDGALDATNLNVTDALIDVSQLFGNPSAPSVFFNFNANSADPAVVLLGFAIQHYNGTFCISTGASCTGVDLLSGSFSDAAVGKAGGPGVTVNVNNPPDSLTLQSDVIAAAELAAPNTLDFGFSNVIPPLNVCGTSLCSFTASLAGTVSANVVETPEPASLVVLAMGLLGLGFVRSRRQ